MIGREGEVFLTEFYTMLLVFVVPVSTGSSREVALLPWWTLSVCLLRSLHTAQQISSGQSLHILSVLMTLTAAQVV